MGLPTVKFPQKKGERPLFWVAAVLMVLAGCRESAMAPVASGSFERYSFTNDAGTRTYKVYVPTVYVGAAIPLIIELHGCGGTADEEARWSRFNELAEARGLLVAYPEQSRDANGSGCWNWFLEEHQARDLGEASIIAGITREVMARWSVDPSRVFVGGISAGGAMSNIMAVSYPDLYAAAMVYAGCQYQGGATCLGAQGTLSEEQAGDVANTAMGDYARVVPIIAIVGDLDQEAPAANTEQVVQQHLANNDLVDDGENNDSVDTSPSETETGEKPGGHTWSIDTYRDDSACVHVQRWLINGMAHAWSNGGNSGTARDELFTDAAGPDVTTPIVDFFLSHPMPPAGSVQCHQARV